MAKNYSSLIRSKSTLLQRRGKPNFPVNIKYSFPDHDWGWWWGGTDMVHFPLSRPSQSARLIGFFSSVLMGWYVVSVFPRKFKPIVYGHKHFSFSILSEVFEKEAKRSSIKDCYKDNILNLKLWPQCLCDLWRQFLKPITINTWIKWRLFKTRLFSLKWSKHSIDLSYYFFKTWKCKRTLC